MQITDNWPLILQIVILLSPFLIGAVGLGIGLKMALTRDLANMLNALQNSPYIVARSWMAKGGFMARLHLVAVIGGMVWFPKPGLRRGVLSEADLSAFPPDLKRKQGWAQGLTCAGFSLLIVIWMLGKWG